MSSPGGPAIEVIRSEIVLPPGAPPPIAVADIGSNTVHLLVAEVEGGRLVDLLDESLMLRLGDDVDRTGEISDAKVAIAIETIARFRDDSLAAGAETLHLMATQAVRIARNRESFVARLAAAVGLPVTVLTPEAEARLAFEGVTRSVPDLESSRLPPDLRFMLVDIGGGSTQLSLGDGERFLGFHSLPIGSGKLTTLFVKQDPPTAEELAAVRNRVAHELAAVPDRLWRDVRPVAAVGVGGSVKTARRLAEAGGEVGPIGRLALQALIERVRPLPAERVVQEFAIKPDRARVLLPGLLLLAGVMARFGLSELWVRSEGIRDGAVLRVARGEPL